MAKRTPFTSQAERLERQITNLQSEVAAIKGMVDTDRSIITAQILKVTDPSSPQIIRVSEGGTLEAGGEPLPWVRAITVEASHTGDTAETEVGKITLPGNKMGPNGFIRVFASFRAIRNGFPAASHVFHIRWGGIRFARFYSSGDKVMYDTPHQHIWNRDATDSQGSGPLWSQTHVRGGEDPFATGKDTTQDVDITFTVTNGNAGHIAYLRFALVEAFYRD